MVREVMMMQAPVEKRSGRSVVHLIRYLGRTGWASPWRAPARDGLLPGVPASSWPRWPATPARANGTRCEGRRSPRAARGVVRTLHEQTFTARGEGQWVAASVRSGITGAYSHGTPSRSDTRKF